MCFCLIKAYYMYMYVVFGFIVYVLHARTTAVYVVDKDF